MKKHSDQIRVILFAVIGAILMYAIYRCTEQKTHYIQEDKTINLNDYLRNVE